MRDFEINLILIAVIHIGNMCNQIPITKAVHLNHWQYWIEFDFYF